MKRRKLLIKFVLFVPLALFFFYLILFYGFFVPSELKDIIATHNTKYVNNYSKEKMKLIKFGMSPEEVVAILGEPQGGMLKPAEGTCPSWSYQRSGTWDTFPPFAKDVYWRSMQVCFGSDGRVSYSGVENVFFN